MRLVTFESGNEALPGLQVEGEILDLRAIGGTMPEAAMLPGSIRGILKAGGPALDILKRVHDASGDGAERLRASGALMPAGAVRLLAPVEPRIIISAGSNYRAHFREMGGLALPTEPSAFLKNVNSVIGPDAPIVLPKHHAEMVDWEAEFSVVIGRPCHNVSAAEALDHVAGYTLANDVSARDWAKPLDGLAGLEASQAWDRNMLGKQFPTFCPLGPAIVTKDEISDPDKVAFRLTVNGELMQDAVTDDLVFRIADFIAYYSRFYPLMPGDVITTGSPSGVGLARKPPLFLKAGDVIEIHSDVIGTLRNPVAAEAA